VGQDFIPAGNRRCGLETRPTKAASHVVAAPVWLTDLPAIQTFYNPSDKFIGDSLRAFARRKPMSPAAVIRLEILAMLLAPFVSLALIACSGWLRPRRVAAPAADRRLPRALAHQRHA
jgi:hypothetical protein